MWWLWKRSTKRHTALARVIVESAGMIADDLADEMDGERQTTYGVGAYDRHLPFQRLRLLTEVVATFVERRRLSLLSDAERTATVEAICRHTAAMVRQEIQAQLRRELFPGVDPCSWRAVVWPCISAGRTGLISADSVDMRGWRFAVEILRNHIQQHFDEEVSAANDSSARPEASFVEIDELWRRLRALTHEPVDPAVSLI